MPVEADHPLTNQTLKKLGRAYDKITLVDEWQDKLWPNGCETKGKKKARRQKKHHYWADHKWATQIGEGEIDFIKLGKILNEKCPNATFIPEIWQGHKNNGEGFWVALEKLENLI